MARLTMSNVQRATDANGAAENAAKRYIYDAGTTDIASAYSDEGLTTAQANPLTSDSSGVFAQSYLPDGSYKVVIKDSAGVTLYEEDNVTIESGVTTGYVMGFGSVTEMLADTTMSYTAGEVQVATDDYVEAGGFRYKVAATGATDADVTTSGSVKLYKAWKPPIVLVAAGQSNIASSNAQAAGGTLTTDVNIRYWNGSAFVTWDPSSGVGVGASGYNAILFQAAREARSNGHETVFCINDGHAGDAIAQWTGSGTASTNYVALKGLVDGAMANSDITGLNITTIDGFIWGQGESDGSGTFVASDYASDFATLKTQLRAESWFAADTVIVALETPGWATNTAAYQANRYFVDYMPFDDDPYTWTVRTRGLDDGADNLHWTGDAMDVIGLRAYRTLMRQIRSSERGQPDTFRYDTPLFELDPANGKGLMLKYDSGLDQVTLGTSSRSSKPSFAGVSVTFDIDGGFVRANHDFFTQGKFEALAGVIFKSYNGSDFVDSADVVNTDADKKEGMGYWDAANDRFVVAKASGATGKWAAFTPNGEYDPATGNYTPVSGSGVYEEGDWSGTAAITDGAGNTATLGSGPFCKYTRVGNKVECWFDFRNIDTTGMTAGNILYVTGLPFAAASDGLIAVGATEIGRFSGGSGNLVCRIGPGGSSLVITQTGAGDPAHVIVSDLTSGQSDIYGHISYRI